MNTIEQIKDWSAGVWLANNNGNTTITELAIDSRHIEHPEHALFVAIKTPVRNGHDYIANAWQQGVRNFLVSQQIDVAQIAGSNIILVSETLPALQAIAAHHREQYNIPVVGITGSNGKTIVKEWLTSLLSADYNIVRSPKSYNSQIGVPLSVWLMDDEHELAVFEAGISISGEMKKLQTIIKPTIGVLTNIGAAHDEGFRDAHEKVSEKLQLFAAVKQLVYCADNPILQEGVAQLLKSNRNIELFNWSHSKAATLQVTQTTLAGNKTKIAAIYAGKSISISIPFTDEVSVENAIQCWCTLLLMGVGNQVIKPRMERLQPISMRMELKHGVNDCTIINDTYNSDLTSVQLALNYLGQQKQHTAHTVILSDIMQPGKEAEALYEEIAGYVSRRNINRFIGIGPNLYKNRKFFKKEKKLNSAFYRSTADFLKHFHLLLFEKEAILLKGARVFAFEKIALLLEQKVHQTVMYIDLSAMRHNLDVFRGLLKPEVKIMAMVKAFAYGSGSYEIANLLQYAGVDYLAVAYTDEGVALRKAGIKLPIMVMSPEATSFDRMIAWQLEPELYSFKSFEAFTTIATTLQTNQYPVHIKLDTGMHRLGFNPEDIDMLVSKLNSHPEIKVASIFSHLAASDDEQEQAFTTLQANEFEKMSNSIMQNLDYKPILHLSNSAGISRQSTLQYDMVRLGLGLYGIDGNKQLQKQLRPISTLKTNIAQIREIPAGANIGYGHHTIATESMKIATISIGYADGYSRYLGNGRGYVLINGNEAPTVGNICMDMCMVNISEIADVEEGDEVIVFGENLPISKIAGWANTIPYEIMTGISQRVKRVYSNGE